MKHDKTDKILDSAIDALYIRASGVIVQARETAYRQINEALVKRNWELGKLIAEEELNGQDRATYGAAIIKGLSKRLTANYGKGFTKTNLYSYSQFYKVYPKIFHSLRGKSSNLLSDYFFRNNSFVRANNQGHRIDYFLASRSFVPQIVRAEIIKNCTVSTNNPILLEIRY